MKENTEKEDLLSDMFVHCEQSWHWLYLYPENTGLPVVLFINSHSFTEYVDRAAPPLVMFYPYKKLVHSKESKRHHQAIPMVICDKPYIPKEYEHRKHELTDDELNEIKNWVAKYKDELLDSDENTFVLEALENCGAARFPKIDQEPLSEEFVWDEHIWDYLEPEYTGLPVILFIDEHITDKTATPMIMFYPCKFVMYKHAERSHAIPMAICDKPYIPKEYEHRKHELTEDELNEIKDWVSENKNELLLTLDENSDPMEALEKKGVIW